jgi:hypothetical protein
MNLEKNMSDQDLQIAIEFTASQLNSAVTNAYVRATLESHFTALVCASTGATSESEAVALRRKT